MKTFAINGNRRGPVLVVAAIALGAVVGGLAARLALRGDAAEAEAGAPAFLADLPAACDGATEGPCSFDNGTLALVTGAEAVDVDDDGTATVSGAVRIPTAGGEVDLVDSDLTIDVDEDGNIVGLEGMAEAPLPDFGPFAAAAVVDGARAEVGFDWGRNLTDLGAHLDPDRQYFYFRFADTYAMRTGFDQLFGDVAGLPLSLAAPGDVSVTMVLDPLDPYFYIGGACPSFGDDANDRNDESGRDDDSDNPDDDKGTVTVGENDGEDCGLGASLNGNIPFEARSATGVGEELRAFAGHIVVDHSEIPVATGVELDGTLTVRTLDAGLLLGGNGEGFVSVPLLDEVADLSFPLGDASAVVQLIAADGGWSGDLFLDGVLDTTRAYDELPDWLSISPTQNQTLRSQRCSASAAPSCSRPRASSRSPAT